MTELWNLVNGSSSYQLIPGAIQCLVNLTFSFDFNSLNLWFLRLFSCSELVGNYFLVVRILPDHVISEDCHWGLEEICERIGNSVKHSAGSNVCVCFDNWEEDHSSILTPDRLIENVSVCTFTWWARSEKWMSWWQTWYTFLLVNL